MSLERGVNKTRYQERENNQERVNRSSNCNRYETPINNLRESLYEQSLEVPIDTIRQEESNLQDPEIHEVGDIPQVSGRDIEEPTNGQMEMSRERMVSRDSYTSVSPETPERRQLCGSKRDGQTVPADHLERRRSSTSEEEILRGVTRGPSIFQEITIREPEDSNVIPPTSQIISSSAAGGVQTYGGGPTGPSGITFPSAGYVPRKTNCSWWWRWRRFPTS